SHALLPQYRSPPLRARRNPLLHRPPHRGRRGCPGDRVMTTQLPNDIIPNQTDPANTASNGPAVLDESTIADYTSERTLTRPRASAPQDYDLVILSSFGGPEGQDDVIPFLRNVTAGRGIP